MEEEERCMDAEFMTRGSGELHCSVNRFGLEKGIIINLFFTFNLELFLICSGNFVKNSFQN